MVNGNDASLFYLDDSYTEHPDIPEVRHMTMTIFGLNEGVGGDTVGPVLAIECSESIHLAPYGAQVQQDGEAEQGGDKGKQHDYLSRREDDIWRPLWYLQIHRQFLDCMV